MLQIESVVLIYGFVFILLGYVILIKSISKPIDTTMTPLKKAWERDSWLGIAILLVGVIIIFYSSFAGNRAANCITLKVRESNEKANSEQTPRRH